MNKDPDSEPIPLGSCHTPSFLDAPCGYVVTNDEGLIVEANAEFARLVAEDLHELVARRTLGSFLPRAGRMYLETHLLPMLQHSGQVREIALDVLGAGGERVPVLMNADRVGSGEAMAAVLLEARERHRYEANLLQATQAAEQARAEATDLARTLQQTLIPPAPPQIPGLHLAAGYRPAGDGSTVGGDFYDVFQTSAHEWVVILGDVSGKGVTAAAVTAFIRHHIRALAVATPDPADVLRHLDAVMHTNDTDHYATLAITRLQLDPATSHWQVQMALAGHPPPLVRETSGRVREVGSYGSPVGLLVDPSFGTVNFELGDETMVFVTDGVTEARRGSELFGEARLVSLISGLDGHPEALTTGIIEAALDFQSGTANDDIAVVCLKAE